MYLAVLLPEEARLLLLPAETAQKGEVRDAAEWGPNAVQQLETVHGELRINIVTSQADTDWAGWALEAHWIVIF